MNVDIFDSRARGNFKKYSDIDLMLNSFQEIDKETLNKIKDFFEDSKLPYKVDLVLQQKIFEPYRLQIESEKKLLFELEK